MRQAGRYLPEYRELKQKYGFLGIVKNPEIAVEAALQPMRRFDFDCAIAFSDILTIPEALGFPYRFKDGGGIMLERTVENADAAAIDSPAQKVREKLGYVAENISLLRSSLPEKAVFGFCGSPFTLAAYMVEGGGSKTFPKFTRFMRECPDAFERLMEALCSAAGEYALMQAERGIDAFQIFDSNAFLIPDGKYFELSGKWNAKVFSKISGKAKTFLFSPCPPEDSRSSWRWARTRIPYIRVRICRISAQKILATTFCRGISTQCCCRLQLRRKSNGKL